MADKIECVDTIEKFFHLVNDDVEKYGYTVDEVLWIWVSGKVVFEGDSKVTMRTLKEEVRRAASTNTAMAAETAQICPSCNGVGLSSGNNLASFSSTLQTCNKCNGTGKLRHT